MEIVERDSVVDELIDEIVPEGLDWERLVVTYPLPALALAAVGGFFLGRRHGAEILAALSSFAAAAVAENVHHVLGRELG
jgi:membrane protein DedA with SNARE-associated domain